MLTSADVTITDRGYYNIAKGPFKLCKTPKKTTLDDFLDVANKRYFEMFGKEYMRSYHPVSEDKREYKRIIDQRWAAINQRCVNGKYNQGRTAKLSPQLLSYQKKGITVDMTKDEFERWMWSVQDVYDLIRAAGEIPSIDRVDPRKGYEVGNMDMIALHSNIERRVGHKCNRTTEDESIAISARNRQQYRKYVTDVLDLQKNEEGDNR